MSRFGEVLIDLIIAAWIIFILVAVLAVIAGLV